MAKGRGKDQPFGLTAYGYANDVVMDILNVEPEPEWTSKEMQHGIDYELEACIAYEALTGRTIKYPTEVILSDSLPIGGTPDGLILSEGGLIEIKCPNNRNHMANLTRDTSQIQDYYWQMQGYMMLTGAQWCDFVSYSPRFPEHLRIAVHRVERDEAGIAELTERIQTLWNYIQDKLNTLQK